MQGELSVKLVNIFNGTRSVIRRVPNVITTAGVNAHIRVLAGSVASQNYINRMQFGTGSAVPVIGDIALAMPITPIKTIATYTYPDAGNLYRVIFEAFLLAGEGNGFSISEAGLLTPGGTLVARAIFAAVTKTSDYQLHYTWTITS